MKAFLENTIGPIYAKIMARPKFYPFNKALYHLSLRGLGILNSNKASGEEIFISKILPPLINIDDCTILDIGANIGNYSKIIKNNFKTARIFAFEPHPKNFEKLKTYESDNLYCYNLAIGDIEGNLMLFDRADQNGSEHASLYQEAIKKVHKQQTSEHIVSITTLDNFAKKNDIDIIDFLKIDTEGHEYNVLKGAKKLISNNQIRIIQFEFGTLHCISKHFIYEFKELLPNHTLYRLLPTGLLKLDLPTLEEEIFGYQNIIAKPNFD